VSFLAPHLQFALAEEGQRTRVVAALRGEGIMSKQIRIGGTGGHYDDKK